MAKTVDNSDAQTTRDGSPQLFGFECELSNGARQVVGELHDRGLSTTDHLHGYHCGCHGCAHDPDRPYPFHAQEDCTVDGEVISKPLPWGPEGWGAIGALADTIRAVRAEANDNAGCHVHVTAPDDATRRRVALNVTTYAVELERYAGGKARQVRGYNRRMTQYRDAWSPGAHVDLGDHSTMLDASRMRTIEFRVWNGTTAAWRIELYAGLSIAMVNAALSGLVTDGPDDNDQPLRDFLAPWIDDRTREHVDRADFYTLSR